MSLTMESNSAMPKSAARYRAISPLAVSSIVLGVFSISTVFGSSVPAWLLLAAIPLAGVVLGWRALRQIHKAPDEWIGPQLAWLGIGLSLGMWVVGSVSAWWLARAIPFGYQPVSYEMLQPDPNNPTEPIPQSALDMQDKKVFVQGYMQPRRQQTRIKEFVLRPTTGECPFCTPNLKRTEMMRVILQGDLEATYTTHLIGVAGRFRVDVADPNGIPYGLEASYLRLR